MRLLSLVLIATFAAHADVRVMTLNEVLDTALQQNPDLAIARLDEGKAADGIRVARDPFVPKVVVGSGLAKTFGFPMSIEGSAPSLFQARGIAAIYNKPQSYAVMQARENVKGVQIDTQVKRDEVAFRVAALYLDAKRYRQALAVAKQQVDTLTQVWELVKSRVAGGAEIPLEARKAELRVHQGRQRVLAFQSELENSEVLLAVTIGLSPLDRVQPAEEERALPLINGSEDEVIREAMESSKELRRLQSAIIAKGFEVKANDAARLPKVYLVAQYGFFAKFNNYEDFFQKFQRNNGTLGISVQLPVLTGSAAKAMAAQGNSEISRLRLEMANIRNRISMEARRAFLALEQSKSASDVAKLDLEVQREQVNVLLAQLEAGRLTQRQIEEARFLESEKWMAYYDARHNLDRAELQVLKHTGGLLALRGK